MTRGRTYRLALIATGAALMACAGDGNQASAPTEVSGFTPRQLSAMDTLAPHVTPHVRPSGLLQDLLGQSKPLPLFVCVNNGGPYTDSAVVGLLGGTMHFG